MADLDFSREEPDVAVVGDDHQARGAEGGEICEEAGLLAAVELIDVLHLPFQLPRKPEAPESAVEEQLRRQDPL